MGNLKCVGKVCCLDKIFPGEDRDKFECANGCFLYETEQEFVDYYKENYEDIVEKYTTKPELLDLEGENQSKKKLKSPYKEAVMPGKIVEEFKAYTIKWRCNKGHANFQTVLDKNTMQQDICIKCGKHYEYKIK